MTSIDELAPPSSSLKAADLEGSEVTVTISGYIVKEFEETDQKSGDTYTVRKPIFSFEETEKTFVCNKTNMGSIAYAYGKEMDDWIGKKVTLYPTMVKFGTKDVEAIRVRVTKQATAKPKILNKGKHTEANPPPHQGTRADLDDEIPFAPEWRG